MANVRLGRLHVEEVENHDSHVSERVVEAPELQQRKVRVRIMRACHLLPANGPEDTSPFCQISDRTHQGSTALRTRTIENVRHYSFTPLHPSFSESLTEGSGL